MFLSIVSSSLRGVQNILYSLSDTSILDTLRTFWKFLADHNVPEQNEEFELGSMKLGPHKHIAMDEMDYKQLRMSDPKAARRAVIQLLRANEQNISKTAQLFGINRSVVYDIIRKAAEGNLEDRPRVPKHQPTRTPWEIEDRVIQAKNRTALGPKRLALYLEEHEELAIPVGTLRHIMRRKTERKVTILAADSGQSLAEKGLAKDKA